jgi:alpha-mannosidase
VFGYSACLPTIMAGFDVPYFYTTKMHWSGATRFPFSSFKWVGMDGSAVVSHISWHHYNQRVRPDEFRRLAMQHRQSAVHDEGLFPCGFGDGGGGLNDEMCERARRLANLASMPRAKWGSIETFFDRLADKQDRLPNWRGEMYLEYHRGVQTTHSHLKAAFRAAERGLQVWEAVRCATGGGPVDEQMWKRVCFAQFHDYIPGSSIQEVYDEHVPELQGIAEKALQRAAQELAATAGNAAEPCVFNPLPVERCVLIDGRLVELPPLAGVAVVGLKALDAPKVKASEKSLSNNRLEAAFNALGEVVSLTVEGHQLALDGPAAQLWTFADIPAIYDAWDIDRYTLSSGTHQTGQAACKVESAEGGLSGSVAFTRSLGELGDVTLRYKLEAGSAVLGIEVDLDLRAKQTLVKLVFPTGYRGREARYGGPFGSVRRPQWDGPLANDAAFENPASRWAVVADDDERDGLMVITEAKYGFGAREGLMHLSLARSAMVTPTNIVGDTTSLGAADEGVTFADLGRQHIRLAVGRFRADAPREQQPAVLADTLFTPVLRYAGQPVDAGLRGIDGPASLVPCWAVPESAQRWTLRLHETLGSRGELGLQLAAGRSAVATDLRGQPARKSTPGQAVSPYSLQSYAIQI